LKGADVAKLSISKAWDEARGTLGHNAGLLTTVGLAMFVLPGVVSDLITPEAPQGQLPPLGAWTVVAVIALLIALVGQLAVIRLAIGSHSTVGEAIGHGARRAPFYFAATVIWILPFLLVGSVLIGLIARDPGSASPGAIIGLLTVACIMLFFAIRMLMTSPVASAESLGPVGIIKRSWQLTAGNFWRMLAFFLLFIITLVVAALAIGAIAGVIAEVVLGGSEPMTVGALFISLVTQLVSAAVSVVLMVMLARIYVQLAGDGAAEAGVPTTGS
jgi:hypothetical protein